MQLWDLTTIQKLFSGKFLDVLFPLGANWYITLLLFALWLYIIKKGGLEKGLYAGLPIFLFGSIFLIVWFGFDVVKFNVSVMLIIYVLVWVIHTRLFQKL